MVTSALEAGYADIVLREEDSALQKVGRYYPIVRKGEELFADGKQIGQQIAGQLGKAFNAGRVMRTAQAGGVVR